MPSSSAPSSALVRSPTVAGEPIQRRVTSTPPPCCRTARSAGRGGLAGSRAGCRPGRRGRPSLYTWRRGRGPQWWAAYAGGAGRVGAGGGGRRRRPCIRRSAWSHRVARSSAPLLEVALVDLHRLHVGEAFRVGVEFSLDQEPRIDVNDGNA